MNNWYFGDVNDYQKYGVLRAIQEVTNFRILVAWMLARVEKQPKGSRHTDYLSQPTEWREYDPDLFDRLRKWVVPGKKGDVRLIECSGLLCRASFYGNPVSDDARQRQCWTDGLIDRLKGVNLVFLDPDTGLEVKSKPLGTKDSAKYVYWQEVESLWNAGVSLLIYQHFARQPREAFIAEKIHDLREHTHKSRIAAFETSHMLLLLAMQPQHAKRLLRICQSVNATWKDQIVVREPPSRVSGVA
jgi:hypothetical protein